MEKKKPKNPLIPSYNVRHDGWTTARTKTFLATLRQTGCVKDAARVIGMSTVSGYRLRKKDAHFRKAWDGALADARRGLVAAAHERAVVGKETIIIRKGVEVERRIAPDSAMLALLIKQGKMGTLDTSKFITQQEWEDGFRFDKAGEKYQEEQRDTLEEKLQLIQQRLVARGLDRHSQGERTINIKTGEGVTQEVYDAAMRFGGGGGGGVGPGDAPPGS